MKFYSNLDVGNLVVTGNVSANNYPPSNVGSNNIGLEVIYEEHKLPRYKLNSTEITVGDNIIWTAKTTNDDIICQYSGVAGNTITEDFAEGLYESPTFHGWCGTTVFSLSVNAQVYEMTVYNLGVEDLQSKIVGYAKTGISFAELTPVVITESTQTALNTALATPNRYVTFAPSIANSDITLTSISYHDLVNGVLDGRERNIRIRGYDTKFDDAQNIIVAYIKFYDATGLADSSHLAFRSFTVDSYIAVIHCEFDVALDESCSFGWSQGNSVYFSVQSCKFTNTDKGSLADFGTGIPLEGGNYYGTYYRNYWYKIKQRQPMLRNGIAYVIQNVHEDFSDAVGGGTAINPADGGQVYCVADCVKPASVGTPDFEGTLFTAPRNIVTSSTPSGNLAMIGAYGMVSDDGLKTGIWTELNPNDVPAIPTNHGIGDLTHNADDTLYSFIKTQAGYI